MADRSSIDLDSADSLADAVVLAEFPATVGGIGHPANTGYYPLSIGSLDRNGVLLNPQHPLQLQPGQSATWYYPPADAFQIVAAGWRDQVGSTTLEYDTPNA